MFRKHLPYVQDFVPSDVLDAIETTSYDKDGILRVSVNLVDASNQCLISTSEYTLSQLLAAGAPLQVLPAVMDSAPSDSQINNIVEHLND